jgi:hypothetical protein
VRARSIPRLAASMAVVAGLTVGCGGWSRVPITPSGLRVVHYIKPAYVGDGDLLDPQRVESCSPTSTNV